MSQAAFQLGDSEVRPALRSRLLTQHARGTDTVVIEELGLCRGQVRVDLAVVNGSLHGFEIKSDRDSLRRLGTQVETYSKVLDRATIVTGLRHLPEVSGTVPTWWGILSIHPSKNGPRFKTVRREGKNPQRDPRALVELLWLDEAIALLERRDATRGVRGKPRPVVWDRVCENFDVEEIAATVCSRLKARATTPTPA